MKGVRILLIFIVLFPFAASALDPLVPPPSPFQVHLFPYVLKKEGEPMYPGQRIGKLVFRDAVELKSETYRFGGFSALNVADGKIYALSDEGRLLRAKLALKKHKIVALSDASFDALWPEGEGEPEKQEYDAEALAHLRGDYFAIGFEQYHRVGLYRFGKKIEEERALLAPEALSHLTKPNEGVEALAEIAPDRLLALTEAAKDKAGNIAGYIVNMKSGKWEPLTLKATGVFLPTELAVLDATHLLLLERSYSTLDGVAARLSTIQTKDVRPGAVLKTTEIARFNNRSNIDNMEGMEVLKNKDGSKDILLLSDDNFNPLQHTILVWLNLPNSRR